MSSTQPKLLSLSLLAALVGGLAACGGGTDAVEETSRLTAGEVADRPLDGSFYPSDGPAPLAIAELPDEAAELGAREQELRERELAVREAELAAREAAVARREAAAASAPRAAPAATRPAPAPAAPVAPAPRRSVELQVPAGTTLAARLGDDLASDRSQVGQPVSARVLDDVWADGGVAIPAGSTLHGTVADVKALRRVGGRARLGLDFHSVTLPGGESAPLAASYQVLGRSETRRDAPTVLGSAAGGAVLGNVLAKKRGGDRAKGGAIGAAVGGAIGTVIAARTEGEEAVLPAGSEIELTLEAPVSVNVRG